MDLESTAGRAAISAWLKTQMSEKGVSYPELGRRLAEAGVPIERTVLHNKIKRGSFSAAFLVQVMQAIGAHQALWQEVAAHLPKGTNQDLPR